MVNCPRLQQIFKHTTAAEDENYDNSNEYNSAFSSLARSAISS
jgi:hypothetical protein